MIILSQYRFAALLYAAHQQNLIQEPFNYTDENLSRIVNEGDPIVVDKLEEYFKKREEWLKYHNEFLKRGTLTHKEAIELSELNASCDVVIKEIEDYIKLL